MPHIKNVRKGISETEDVDSLKQELAELQDQVFRLTLEKDILEGTGATLKKDGGTDPRSLTAQEKTELIGVLKTRYKLPVLLEAFALARSTYYYQASIAKKPPKYQALMQNILTISQENCNRYGYRRIRGVLNHDGVTISEKVVLRLMREIG
jgi:hypothetical protein